MTHSPHEHAPGLDTGSIEAFGRTIVLGNSGSGKSWLAIELAAVLRIEAVDLDPIHWQPGGYDLARGKLEALEMVRQIASRPRWIIEGVYGWLAHAAVPRATTLIWIDVPVEECLANLRRRGRRRGGTDVSFQALLAWAALYPARSSSSSFEGHRLIYEAFSGQRLRLNSRTASARLLSKLAGALQ